MPVDPKSLRRQRHLCSSSAYPEDVAIVTRTLLGRGTDGHDFPLYGTPQRNLACGGAVARAHKRSGALDRDEDRSSM